MKLTGIDLYSSNTSTVVSLDFKDPRSQNPYQIGGIAGLDADEIVPQRYKGSESDFYTLTMKKRNLDIKIGLNPRFNQNESFSSLRDSIYRLVSASRTGMVTINFKNAGEIVATVSGLINKVTTDQFSKEQAATVSIECISPMLKSPEPVIVDVSDLDVTSTIITDSKSTAPHGFEFELEVLTLSNSIQMIVGPDNEMFKIWTPYAFIEPGNLIIVSSDFNNKSVVTKIGPNYWPVMDRVTADSFWPIIFPGENLFSCSPNVKWKSISYYTTYWGV